MEFEFDFCIALGLMLGLSYEEAKEKARQWLKEAHKED